MPPATANRPAARDTVASVLPDVIEPAPAAAVFPHKDGCPADPARIESHQAVKMIADPDTDRMLKQRLTITRCVDCGTQVATDATGKIRQE